ncbi:MAG: hypothetical protein LRS46_00140 [Desulfurococcales archaeon]|nr:hypothetical protein [Desulfurococcales archaeon]
MPREEFPKESLTELLEELVGETHRQVHNESELAERFKRIREKALRLLREAPLLALALGWTRGDCRKPVEFPPFSTYRRYVTDTQCLLDLIEYLEKHESIIGRELECEFSADLMFPLSKEEPLTAIADLFNKLRINLEKLLIYSEPGQGSFLNILRNISLYYLWLLIILRLYCCYDH